MYYINPWVFYIIGLIVHIQIFCICVAVAGGIIWLLAFPLGPMCINDMTKTKEQEEVCLKTFWKWMKRFPLIFFICVGVAVITPDEETMYKMMIASKISTDDVDHVIERLDDVVDAIIESKEQVDDTNS